MKIFSIIAIVCLFVNVALCDNWRIVSTNESGIVTGVSTEMTPTPHVLGPNEYPLDYSFPTNSFENWKKVGDDWLEMTPEDIQARYNAQQMAKPIELKVFENLYVTFLTNEWTGALRAYGLIDTNTTITVTNADTSVNVGYLMQLRALDSTTNKPTYSYYKNEFSTFRDNLERMAGSNALPNVRWHQEIVPPMAAKNMVADPADSKTTKWGNAFRNQSLHGLMIGALIIISLISTITAVVCVVIAVKNRTLK